MTKSKTLRFLLGTVLLLMLAHVSKCDNEAVSSPPHTGDGGAPITDLPIPGPNPDPGMYVNGSGPSNGPGQTEPSGPPCYVPGSIGSAGNSTTAIPMCNETNSSNGTASSPINPRNGSDSSIPEGPSGEEVDPGFYVNGSGPSGPGQSGEPGNTNTATPCYVPGSAGATSGSAGGSSGSGSSSSSGSSEGSSDTATTSNPSIPICNNTSGGDGTSVSSPINTGNGDSGNSGSPTGGVPVSTDQGADAWGNTNLSAVTTSTGTGSGSGRSNSNNNFLATSSAGLNLPAGVMVTTLVVVLTLY